MFFEKAKNLSILEKLLSRYWSQEGKKSLSANHEVTDELMSLLVDSLAIVKEIFNHPKTWDQHIIPQSENLQEFIRICEYFNRLENDYVDLQRPIEILYLCTLRILYEVDFKRNNQEIYSTLFNDTMLGKIKLNAAINSKNETFSNDVRKHIDYIIYSVPYDVLKNLFNSDEFSLFSNFDEKTNLAKETLDKIQSCSDSLNEKISSFESRLIEKQNNVNALQKTLEKHENAFNFVGLYKGFNDLAKSKKVDAKSTLFILLVLASSILALPLIGSVVYFFHGVNTSQNISFLNHLLSLFPLISLELLLIYFFRVVLHNYKSIEAQILQIELRQTLCQFIQSYSEYSKDVRTETSNPLEKFENLIFSGITSDSENLPSTFDGMDQLTKLFSSLKKGS
ncbi:hypothetical protein MTF66_06585 [Pseudoalteromonas sp. 2CM39R]|uniref:hypothetical protein n=1 Tax=Pseudoalteromonas sp. 2CM39R TaxID=2929856 RepID=UPI0020C04665|nr:hypothetical protein [Pseudoalteromonas sp. 2CM39R]MCK8124658.1 hypothetical protein [Pseudoalteromonas sp. 2CM39R]